MGRHLKPQAGHTLVSESAHSSPSEGLQVTDRQTQQTLQPTQRLLLWPLRPAGPNRTEQLLLWSRRVTGWPTPLTSRHCSRDTAPHQGRTSPLLPEGEALSSGTHAPSFSTEVLVTAKQTLRPPGSTRRLSPQTFGGPRVHSQPTHGVPAGVHPSESLREALPSPVSSSGVIKGEGDGCSPAGSAV